MPTVPSVTSNTLIDQTFFANLVDAVNGNADAITRASSSIWNTGSNPAAAQISYVGSFAFSTAQKVVDHTLSTTAKTYSTTDIGFGGINFTASPLVFVTIQANGTTGPGSSVTKLLNGVSVTDVTQTGAKVHVNFDINSSGGAITYTINVLAIGPTL